MYLFGVWITSAKLYAESVAEAIFDADLEMTNKDNANLKYALWDWDTKTIVKSY